MGLIEEIMHVTYSFLPLEAPEPLRMASLPVACMAATMAEGGANIRINAAAPDKTQGQRLGTDQFLL